MMQKDFKNDGSVVPGKHPRWTSCHS